MNRDRMRLVEVGLIVVPVFVLLVAVVVAAVDVVRFVANEVRDE